jgi:signal transduction histidine kinase
LTEATPTERADPARTITIGPRVAAWLSWSLWAIIALLIASSLLLDILTPSFLTPPERPDQVLAAASALLSLACPTLGAFIARRSPTNPVGWIFCGMGLIYALRRFAVAYADYALLVGPQLPLGEQAAWISTWLGFSWLVMLIIFLVLLFPDGRLPSRRWRVVAWTATGGTVMATLGEAFRIGPLWTYYYVHNPYGIAGSVGGVLPAYQLFEASDIVGGALLSVGCFASVAVLVRRLRQARGDERKHLEWFTRAAAPTVILSALISLDWTVDRFALLFLGKTVLPIVQVASKSLLLKGSPTAGRLLELQVDSGVYEFLAVLSLFMVPACTGVALLRYRLYDVDYVSGRSMHVLASGISRLSWSRIFIGGAIVGFVTFAFMYLTIYAYVVSSPAFGQGHVDLEQRRELANFVSGLGARTFFLAITILVTWRVARKVNDRAIVHGTLVGVIAAVIYQAIMYFLHPPLPLDEMPIYLALGILGGWLGGVAGRTTLAGSVYRASQQIGKADNPAAVAAAIGEHLGGLGLHGAVLWRVTSREDRHGGKTGDRPPREFVHWGSWTLRDEDAWAPETRLGAEAIPTFSRIGERPSAVVQTAALPAAEQAAWEHKGIRSAFLMPLLTPDGTWTGLLMLTFRERRRFSRRAGRAYLTVGAQAALALENMRLVEEARRAGRRAGVLIERQRLAREIHDTLAQGFISVITNLTAAEVARHPDAVDTAPTRHLQEARRTARESLAAARRLVWALRPPRDRRSLSETLKELTKEWSEKTGVEARAVVTGTPHSHLPEIEIALLRATQETLANVSKHARATMVNITLSYMDDRVVLDVLDDGVGFGPDRLKNSVGSHDAGGFGLVALRERVEHLGGTLVVESTPGEGTTIVVELPLGAGGPKTEEPEAQWEAP